MKPIAAEVQRLESRVVLSSIHFVGAPSIEVSGRTVDVSFTVAGIGNEPIASELTVTGVADVRIDNPGGNDPPGQQVPFVLTTADFTATSDKNGNVTYTASFTVTDEMVTSGIKLKKGWTADVTSVAIADASLTVTQGEDVLTA
jgi:hypothetical protein